MRNLAWMMAVFSVSSFAATEPGLKIGNVFTATAYDGSVTVICGDVHDTGIYEYACADETLTPRVASEFKMDPGIDADQVVLKSTWENGKIAVKKSDFDPKIGESVDVFNLWLSTLLQSPLLSYGTNRIHYVLNKDGVKQAEGDFTAKVKKAPAQHCGHGVVREMTASSCRNGGWMCQRFFDEEAHCSPERRP